MAKAYYQHHERTTASALAGDLQLREIGIDPENRNLMGYSEVLGLTLSSPTNRSTVVDFNLASVISASLISGSLVTTGVVTVGGVLSTQSTSILGALTALKSTTVEVLGGTDATIGVLLANVSTNSTSKQGRLKVGHYTNSEEPVTLVIGVAGASTNQIFVGGGSSTENAATSIDFYTASANATVSGTRRGGFNNVGVFDVVGGMRLTAFTTQYTIPFVTNTSGDLGASTALVFNSSTETLQTGSGTFSATLGVTGLLTLSSGVSIAGGSAATGRIYHTSADGIVLWSRAGSSTDFVLANQSGNTVMSVPANTQTVVFAGSASVTSTLAVTGIQTNSEALVLGNNGTTGTYRLVRTAADGVVLRGGTGSSNDMALYSASGGIILRNPTGTTEVRFPGDVTLGANATGSNLYINGPASTLRGEFLRTAGVNRWFVGEDTSTESPTDSGSNFAIHSYNDAGTSLGVQLGILRSNGLVVCYSGAYVYGGLSATGDVYSGAGRRVISAALSSNTTLGATHDVVFVTGTTTITLPLASSHLGRRFFIRNTGAANVTLARTSSDLIDGQTSYTLTYSGSGFGDYLGCVAVSDGTNWILMKTDYQPPS